MINIVKFQSFQHRTEPARRYHLQLVHTEGGFKCIAQSEFAGTFVLQQKGAGGLGYVHALRLYEAAAITKSTTAYEPIAAVVPEAEPFTAAYRVLDPSEIEAFITTPTAATRIDDPAHAAGVASAQAVALERERERERELERRRLEELRQAELRELEMMQYFGDLGDAIVNAKGLVPVFTADHQIIQITKNGANVTMQDLSGAKAIKAGALADKLKAIAYDIGGAFTLSVLHFDTHFFFIDASILLPQLRTAVIHPLSAFTAPTRQQIFDAACESERDLTLLFENRTGKELEPLHLPFEEIAMILQAQTDTVRRIPEAVHA